VLSTCSTLLSLVNAGNSQVIQFSHLSVKEFLTSTRFAEKSDTVSRRYHIAMTPAHTIVAQACLSILLHLDEDITRDDLGKFPLVEYAAEHWFEHARFKGVSQNAVEGMKQLFDPCKEHLAVWVWIYDPVHASWPHKDTERPPRPDGTSLHYAAFVGLHTTVKFLATSHPQNVHSRGFADGLTPLHLASREGYVEVASILIEHGADVMAQDKHRSTPLHHASEWGSVVVAHFLVEHGADVTAPDGKGSTPLHKASKMGRAEVARFLLEHGADVMAQYTYGSTPLNEASGSGSVEVARILIEHGADVMAEGPLGSTPLHCVSKLHRGGVDLARFLIEHGADVTARDRYRLTPLHQASQSGNLDLTRFLVEHGADVTVETNDKSTPLHLVSRSYAENVDLARFLIEHGADATAKDMDGSTPLHEVAVCSGGRRGSSTLACRARCGRDGQGRARVNSVASGLGI